MMGKQAKIEKFDYLDGDQDDSIDWEDFIVVQGNFYNASHNLM